MSTGSSDRMHDFTVCLGVDEKTLRQLEFSMPTWRRHKPSLFRRRFLVFYDRASVYPEQVRLVMGSGVSYELVEWPPPDVSYRDTSSDKWGNAQRAKMLSGFVHVPAKYVTTPYWLKIDTDVMAESEDNWVHDSWFGGAVRPAIIAPAWNFTKPPDQMLKLDEWVAAFAADMPELAIEPPLDIRPTDPSADRVGHRRICSWCAFFGTEFTQIMAAWASSTCGEGKMPVPSQDGFAFYTAKRLGLPIIPVQMKHRGWRLVTHGRMQQVSQELMAKGL